MKVNDVDLRVSEFGVASFKIGKPLAKKSIIVAKISGLIIFQSTSSSLLVIVMKSGPKNTLLTPSILNNSLPRGEQNAACPLGKSMVCPCSKTGTPGKNFKLFGFGVSCV